MVLNTETYYKLTNFPQHICNAIIEYWTQLDKTSAIEVSQGEMWKYKVDKHNKIYKYFEGANLIEYYEMSAGFVNTPHLDRGRWCALNIPVENNPPYTDFFIGKHFHLAKYQKRPRRDPYHDETAEYGPTGMFKYDDKLFTHDDFLSPIVFSTKIPHGGTNKYNTKRRVLATITFGNSRYEQLLNELPPEWF